MEKKGSFNKTIKIIGNIVMLIAIIFIVKRLIQYDIDYSIIIKDNNLIIFIILVFAYAVSVVLSSIPWKNIVYLMTGENIKFVDVATVSTKANVMKYIPGNVFQYIGRNGLAVEKGLKHTDVALSTLLDVVINLGTVFLVTLFFAFDTVRNWFNEHVKPVYVIVLLLAGAICVSLLIILLYKKKEKYKETIKRIFSKHGIATIFFNILVYAVLSLYTTIIYMIVMYVISDGSFDLSLLYYVAGAILASWILGFITPGAPGGMGIRETVLIMLLGNIMKEQVILLSVVVNRVVSILGDVLALVAMQVINKLWRTKKSE